MEGIFSDRIPLPPPHMDEDERRRGGSGGEDLISGLPDDVLHDILVRLGCARAAARTSVLSRRWRPVWKHMPELLLVSPSPPPGPAPASFLDAVDGALDGCLSPALDRLAISLSADSDLRAPARRVAPWLRFAAERVAGKICLIVPPPLELPLPPRPPAPLEEAELELPACGGAKAIALKPQTTWRLRPPPSGLFAALTALKINGGRMEGGELSTLVCAQCPRLIDLNLSIHLVAVADVSIRSDSLRFQANNTRRLEVVAPRLEVLTLTESIQAHVSAPKLAKLVWLGGAYDPRNHRFLDVSRRLKLLDIGLNSPAPSLMRQFDKVSVLRIETFILQGAAGYQRFLNETKIPPKCKVLGLSLFVNRHGLTPVILHLLRSCNGTRKFSLTLFDLKDSWTHPCPSSCPCCSEESHRIDNIDLESLDEIEINSYKVSHKDLEFLEMLSRCNAKFLKKLVINYKMSITPPETKEVRSMREGPQHVPIRG
ncbi:unnamed protein product [Urochloa decumbens]|uniref:F-box domain-containing protein n=1 Tax=Urochloa decumbens TaxID=240449 RepID=A0ABC8VWX9_9POAL